MKVLVVGLGNIAQRHIRNLKALEPSASIAVWRQRPDPMGWQPPEGLPVDRWFYQNRDWINWKPDAAIVANPASKHAATAYRLIAQRKQPPIHVFLEKPIAAALDVDGLLRVRENHAAVLMVGYDLRFYRPLQLVKQALDAGRIGRPLSIRCEVGQYLPDWRPGRDYRTSVSARAELGGGVILELSHEIDYARWLMGEVVSVAAMTGRLSDLEIDVEDTADLLLRFESGAQGSVHLDMVDRVPVRRCRVVGTEGSIGLDLLTGKAWLHLPGTLTPLNYLDMLPDPFMEEMRHFLACCRGDAVPPVDGADAVKTLAVGLAAKRSAVEGREVQV